MYCFYQKQSPVTRHSDKYILHPFLIPDIEIVVRGSCGTHEIMLGQICYSRAKMTMKKFENATVIRKFERRINLELNDFPDVQVHRFEEDCENNDSKLAVIPMDNDIEMDAKGDKDDY